MFYNNTYRKENRGSDGNSGVRRATFCWLHWYCVRAKGPGLEERRAMDTLERKMTRGSDRDASCPDTGPLMSVDQRVRSDVRGPDLWLAAACGSLTL